MIDEKELCLKLFFNNGKIIDIDMSTLIEAIDTAIDYLTTMIDLQYAQVMFGDMTISHISREYIDFSGVIKITEWRR